MKLITETIEDIEVLTEATTNGGKSYKIRGVFMQADIKNRNGRVYPVQTLAKEVARYNEQFINKKRAFGELGHPDGPTVNLERVSHMITSLKPEGKNFIGEAKIMDTPYGKIVKNLIDDGAQLGVSSRGMGSIQGSTVGKDFYLATAADIVADPSAPDAFVEGIMAVLYTSDAADDLTRVDLGGRRIIITNTNIYQLRTLHLYRHTYPSSY